MSYDVRLEIDTGGEYPASVTEWRSPTYNLAPMFRWALDRDKDGDGLRGLDGRTAQYAIGKLRAAVEDMEDNPATYKAMNPANGWGDYDGALAFMREFLADCIAHPKASVRT